MRLYNRQAETFLFEKVKSISEQHVRWRAIHIDFSAHQDEGADALRSYVVTNIIKDLLEYEDGYVYLCKDGDVIILFQGKVRDILARLGEQFHDVGLINSPGDDGYYHLFDLSQDWQKFYAICEYKAAETKTPAAPPSPPEPAQKPLRDLDPARMQAGKQARAARKSLLVLIVEDDPFTRRLVIGTLRSEFDIIEAESGASALALYEKHAPDAVFLDIELPDTSGHVVLSKLLAGDAGAFVVMLSANSNKENILAALEKGAQGFATKPFAREKLIHYLRLCETARRIHSH